MLTFAYKNIIQGFSSSLFCLLSASETAKEIFVEGEGKPCYTSFLSISISNIGMCQLFVMALGIKRTRKRNTERERLRDRKKVFERVCV